MEMLRESVPFLVGLVCSPVVWLLLRSALSRLAKGGAFLGGALVTGAAVSLLNGEIIGQNIGEALGSIALDSLLAGAVAAALALFVLKRVLPARQQTALAPVPEQAE